MRSVAHYTRCTSSKTRRMDCKGVTIVPPSRSIGTRTRPSGYSQLLRESARPTREQNRGSEKEWDNLSAAPDTPDTFANQFRTQYKQRAASAPTLTARKAKSQWSCEMTPTPLPPLSALRETLRLDRETGLLYWRGDGTPACQTISREGYRGVRFTHDGGTRMLPAHRVVFALEHGEEPRTVDHRDSDPSNNRPPNLRAASVSQNNCNRPGKADRPWPKGVKPVRRKYGPPKFVASSVWQGRTRHLGTYDTPGEAHAAWCEWARGVHGEFFNPGPEKVTIFD